MDTTTTPLSTLETNVLTHIDTIATLDELVLYRGEVLGKNGSVNALTRGVRDLSDEDKRTFGKAINTLKETVTAAFDRRIEDIKVSDIQKRLNEYEDVTAPATGGRAVHVHPITRVLARVEDVFVRMGYEVIESHEIASEYENFDAVNVPANHPARDMQDTFWIEGGTHVLATQTSSMQNSVLKTHTPPIRVIIPGRVFRNEAVDATHEHTFYQVEGMVVDKGINIGHLRYTLRTMLSEVFGKEVSVRMRPGYFPFVEPGVEVDCSCPFCDGKGCRICKKSGWIELVPAGMIHPRVLREGGIDPDVYSGFAFGLGLNRLAMLAYGINDIRHFQTPDFRFLGQF